MLFGHWEDFLSPLHDSVCLKVVWSFTYSHPGRFGSCSNWQSCRSHLVLQVCQLYHLLTHTSLEDNHRRSSSISWHWNTHRELLATSWPTSVSTQAPFGDRMSVLAPSVRPSTPSRMPCHRHSLSHSLSLSALSLTHSDGGNTITIDTEHLRAPHVLFLASCLLSKCHQVCLELLSLVHHMAARDRHQVTPTLANLGRVATMLAAVVTPTLANLVLLYYWW